MDQSNTSELAVLSEDGVQEMLLLAERLREQSGGELNESAIQAVAEASGAPLDYVRLAVKLMPSNKKAGVMESFRAAALQIDSSTRNLVFSALAGTLWALMYVLQVTNAKTAGADFFGAIMLVLVGLGVWNVSLAKDGRQAAVSGALLAGSFFVAQSLFAFIINPVLRVESALLLPALLGGALGGLAMSRLVDRFRGKLGIADPTQERQELLRQLVELQDKLRVGEQSCTIVSVDIVGSTKLKADADPLSIEFTFNEYHSFVDMVARRYGGRVHSTAGDGVTLAFDEPHQGFAAAKTIQTGILEVNTFRNKIGRPLVLRVGVNTGSVVAPQAGDLTSVNFAHVIDMAAHLQKVCPPGGVIVSDSTAANFPGGYSSIGVERVMVDEVAATIWVPRRIAAKPALPEG